MRKVALICDPITSANSQLSDNFVSVILCLIFHVFSQQIMEKSKSGNFVRKEEESLIAKKENGFAV
jgi:hypothetical protein